jgi:hypothetical protein
MGSRAISPSASSSSRVCDRRDEMHGLRRLHDGVSSNATVRVRSGAGRAEGDLPAVPASRSQHLHISRRGNPPCEAGCPIHQSAQGYVTLIAQGRFEEALQVILRDNPIPSICGRICTHPCTAACTRTNVDDPVNLPALKRFITDHNSDYKLPQPTVPERPEKIAIVSVGAGRPSLCLSTPAERLWHDDLRSTPGCGRDAGRRHSFFPAYHGPC